MSAHTPGPWVVHPLRSYFRYVVPASHASRPIGGSTDAVADIRDYAKEISSASLDDRRSTKEEVEANAILIAAAPELLESCKQLLVCMRLAKWEDDPIAEKARAAISKATGGADVEWALAYLGDTNGSVKIPEDLSRGRCFNEKASA